MDEYPQYAVRPNLVRILVPETVKLLLLGALFYVGIRLNIYFMKMDLQAIVHYLIISIISALLITQWFATFTKVKRVKYEFYLSRLELHSKKGTSTLDYNDVDQARVKVDRNILDDLLGTGTIVFTESFKLRYVANYDQLSGYARKLINYRQYQVQQQTMTQQTETSVFQGSQSSYVMDKAQIQ